MRALIKDRHGTYYAQKRVNDQLQEAVARVVRPAATGVPKEVVGNEGAQGSQHPRQARTYGV